MRILLALATLVALAALAPSATAAQCPPACVGVAVHVETLEPEGCFDCGGVGAAASVQHDGDGTTVSVLVCRGGFVVICPVDQTLTV